MHVAVAAAVLGWCGVVALALLYMFKAVGSYEPVWNMYPDSSSLLSCGSGGYDPATGPTASCIFTGRFDDPNTRGAMTEQEVRNMCSERSDCHGYVRRVEYPSVACTDINCSVWPGLNKGRPVYELHGRWDALQTSVPYGVAGGQDIVTWKRK